MPQKQSKQLLENLLKMISLAVHIIIYITTAILLQKHFNVIPIVVVIFAA